MFDFQGIGNKGRANNAVEIRSGDDTHPIPKVFNGGR
jgi:hypothetical protein